jgi:predicted HTH transcriptional regulator
MPTKHWIPESLRGLAESLAPVPHEVNEIDWKARLSDNSARLAEHLMAFANHPGGGTLVFGVDDDGQPTDITADDVAIVVTTLTNLGRDAVEPPLALDHAAVEFGGSNVLLIRVPEQPVKPVHRRGKSIEETWIRSGGTTRKASRQEVGALMLHSTTPRWEDLRASPLVSLEDVQRMLDLEAIARLLQRPLPEESQDLAKWLADENLASPDGRGYYITNFGAIAAARKLGDFPSLDRKGIRLIRYQGTNKVNTIDELLGQRGYAVGFEGLVMHLKRVLPHSEVIHQSLRAEVSLYPEIALRELIANALIHQNFSISGAGPMVEIYDDRIEVTNPGTLLPSKKPDRLIGTTPESRNEKLASSFRRFRICEERGTGFQKVISAIELFGLPPLLLVPHENAFRVTIGAPRKFADMAIQERIEACYQHAVLQYLSSQTLTNTTLRERFKLHDKHRNQITNLISDAVDAGRIKRKDVGSGKKFAEYVPYWV